MLLAVAPTTHCTTEVKRVADYGEFFTASTHRRRHVQLDHQARATPVVPRLTPEGIAMGRNDLTAPIEPKARVLNGRVARHPRLFEAKELLEDLMPEVLGNAWTGIRHGDLQALWAFKTCKLPRRHADDDLAPPRGIAEGVQQQVLSDLTPAWPDSAKGIDSSTMVNAGAAANGSAPGLWNRP